MTSTYIPPHRRRRPTADQEEDVDDSQHDVQTLCTAFTHIRCINLKSRQDKWRQFERQARRVGELFCKKIQRQPAVDGVVVLLKEATISLVQRQWDATKNAQYSRRVTPGSVKLMTAGEVGCAMSHMELWQELCQKPTACDDVTEDAGNTSMLILEDDAVFTSKRGKSRFARAFVKAWTQLPEDWDIFYLGISGRGERMYLDTESVQQQRESGGESSRYISSKPDDDDFTVRLYRPTYGFHTHAYAITKAGAARLLENLPVVGPIDVWLADNEWFGLSVYCAVIANEGWRLDDGTYEGVNLVDQQRKGAKSDIPQSSSVGNR